MDHNKLLNLCCGNTAAVAFIERFWSFVETWDELVDKDKDVPAADINAAMLWALFGLQDDPFYRAFPVPMRVAMQHCIAAWQTANHFERSGDRALVEQAYFLRCAPYDVFAVAVLMAGGPAQHLDAVAYFRSLGASDSLNAYLQEHLGD